MNVYLDRSRLIFIKDAPSPEFWDRHWDSNRKSAEKLFKKNSYVSNITKEYVAKGATVVEGGCGMANHVYALQQNGYQSIGFDSATKTVEWVRANAPDLDVRISDVRNLSCDANMADAYWSIGVIEHFRHGYIEIINEISRVLKPDGIVFVTFPSMNLLRSFKGRLGFYKKFNGQWENFYQFALEPGEVIDNFKNAGFILVDMKRRNGFKGLKDECPIGIIRRILTAVHDSNKKTAKIIGIILDFIFSRVCGHTTLLVFRRDSSLTSSGNPPLG